MTFIIDLRHTILFIRERGSGYIAVRIGEGNFTYTEKRNIIFAKARGVMDRVREGNEEGVDAQFQFIWDNIAAHDGSIITVEDALKKLNNAANWVSTSTDPDGPYCVDLILQFDPGCANGEENLYFSQFEYENLSHSLKDGSVDCAGTCNYKRAIPY